MTVTGPFSKTRLVAFLRLRISQLSPRKSQREIALLAEFQNPNILTMIKKGDMKLPLGRVPKLAAALEVDPAQLFELALEQEVGGTAARAIMEIFGHIVTAREFGWVEVIRLASEGGDPELT